MDDAGQFDVRRAVLVGVLAMVVLAVTGVVAYRMNGDVPHGTRMLGVDLGGLSRSEAEAVLRRPVAEHAADPVRVLLDGRRVVFPPAALGVRVDVELSVGRAIRSAGNADVEPVVRVDKQRFGALLPADVDRAVRAVRAAWPHGEVATLSPN
ncbi:hypothetical protein BJ973_008036 [Actinoplanes tereljensis]|uniref:Peptidoglycan binding domain-containing protein n=1 Tax=Paractinoplanes tereljensis TaxID=571912 RepID=A0A919NVM3_9ACTN|nr:hypothetical protein [Actinoplanes tereljensis]GIF24557.1 hypothetical protein Ate02nite_72870 [Actinoplanes tereljensis]